jgi:hypothetical protein
MLNSFISYIITIYIGSVVGKKTLLTYNDSINFKIHVEFSVMLHLETVWQRGGVHVSCDLKLQAVW